MLLCLAIHMRTRTDTRLWKSNDDNMEKASKERIATKKVLDERYGNIDIHLEAWSSSGSSWPLAFIDRESSKFCFPLAVGREQEKCHHDRVLPLVSKYRRATHTHYHTKFSRKTFLSTVSPDDARAAILMRFYRVITHLLCVHLGIEQKKKDGVNR